MQPISILPAARKPLFPMGQVLLSTEIAEHVATGELPPTEVLDIIRRHQAGDWGDALPPEDAQINADALKVGARLLSAYSTTKGRVWIITEVDRSATTVLYPSEY